jgi:hypothetical protein
MSMEVVYIALFDDLCILKGDCDNAHCVYTEVYTLLIAGFVCMSLACAYAARGSEIHQQSH